MALDIGAEVAISSVRCWVECSAEARREGKWGNAVAPAAPSCHSCGVTTASTGSVCQSGLSREVCGFRQTVEGENRLGARDALVVMGLIIAAVM